MPHAKQHTAQNADGRGNDVCSQQNEQQRVAFDEVPTHPRLHHMVAEEAGSDERKSVV